MSNFISVNGVELFYKKAGGGEALILLHGNGEDHHIYDKLTKKLKSRYTVYAIDSRNHGKSSKTDDYSYDTMAKDICLFVQKLSLGRVYIAGFSDGAIISLLLALKYSECISKMILLGVNLSPDDFTEESRHYLESVYKETKDPLFKLMLTEPDIKVESLASINIPTLVMGGENDIYKPATFATVSANIPDSELKIMKGHTHDSYIVNEDIIYKDIIEFLG